jgi:hypothetical protein
MSERKRRIPSPAEYRAQFWVTLITSLAFGLVAAVAWTQAHDTLAYLISIAMMIVSGFGLLTALMLSFGPPKDEV